jgi:hypothetical protein
MNAVSILCAYTFAVLLSLTSLAGCGRGQKAAEAVAEKEATVSIAGSTSTIGDGFTADGQQVAEGYGMTYSETALDEVIPALPIFGFANGQAFNAGTVMFRQDHNGNWQMQVSDHDFDPLQGVSSGRIENKDLQTIYITLPSEPASGTELGRQMEYGGGYFQIKKSIESTSTTSWNTSFAYKLEIDEWKKGSSRLGSCGKPEVGSASGRLFASFKGSAGERSLRNSWVSGQFTGAAILYCGSQGRKN